MSGSAVATTAMTPAATATLISVDIAVRPLFPLELAFSLDLFKDLLHCADRMRQGHPDLVRQPHPGAHVGGLARHHQATRRSAAHRVEHREDLVRGEAVRVHYSRGGGEIRRVDLKDGHRARDAAPLRGVDEHEQVAPVEQFVDQVHAPDAEVRDLDARRVRPAGEEPDYLDAEGVIALEDVADPGDQRAAGHWPAPSWLVA